MKLRETSLNMGGIFRCCFSSIGNQLDNKEVEENQVVTCEFCREEFKLNGKEWKRQPKEDEKSNVK